MFEQPIPTLRRDGEVVHVLDQTLLPFRTETVALRTLAEAAHAIRSMQVRGAPLIGATAAFGVALALADEGADDATLAHALATLGATRPTAVNLHWALERMRLALQPLAAPCTRARRPGPRPRRSAPTTPRPATRSAATACA
jgi:methylthioribose-1-phosphate isomerase